MPDMYSMPFADNQAYPTIQVKEKNKLYGKWMLDNVGGMNSEISAVSLYFYNHLITENPHPDISYAFHKISVVEMHHLEIFGKLAYLLGEDPRLWTQTKQRRSYWCPGYNNYPTPLPALLENSLNGELAAVSKYETQLSCIEDPYLCAILKRIILDEKLHIEIFKRLCNDHKIPYNIL